MAISQPDHINATQAGSQVLKAARAQNVERAQSVESSKGPKCISIFTSTNLSLFTAHDLASYSSGLVTFKRSASACLKQNDDV
jgi:hypothetical protein